ncbi:MAG: hypothetical protein IIY81_00505 [Lachnospiraceae bacterium]|nr:hypothetical protein [Lachnospiraceae bacterium]
MGKKRFGKKVLAGIMSLALAASVLPAGAALQKAQVVKTDQLETAAAAEGDTYTGYYTDYKHLTAATGGSIVAYVNGNKDKKASTIYTDMTPSYIYTATTDKKGKVTVKSATSKISVYVTTKDEAPKADAKGKITKDANAEKIAKAAIKNGQITVTAQKEAGKVYLWTVDSNAKTDPTSIPVTVYEAPKKVDLYAKEADITDEKVKNITAGEINITEKQDIYLDAYNVNKDKSKARITDNLSFTAAVDKKSADYFTVEADSNDPYHFTIQANKLNDNRACTGSVTFTCDQSGAKVSFKATSVNHVSDFAWQVADASAKNLKVTAANSEKNTPTTVQVAVTASASAIKGDVNITDIEYQATSTKVTTDTVAVKEITKAQFDKITEDETYAADKKGLPNYKIAANDKSGITVSLKGTTLSVATKKGAKIGTTGYFIVAYSGGVYDLVQVTTAEALSE